MLLLLLSNFPSYKSTCGYKYSHHGASATLPRRCGKGSGPVVGIRLKKIPSSRRRKNKKPRRPEAITRWQRMRTIHSTLQRSLLMVE